MIHLSDRLKVIPTALAVLSHGTFRMPTRRKIFWHTFQSSIFLAEFMASATDILKRKGESAIRVVAWLEIANAISAAFHMII